MTADQGAYLTQLTSEANARMDVQTRLLLWQNSALLGIFAALIVIIVLTCVGAFRRG